MKSYIEYSDYGKINVNLNKILEMQNISLYKLSTETNIKHTTIKSLVTNTSVRIDLEALARICYVLECKVSDIIEYIPPKP